MDQQLTTIKQIAAELGIESKQSLKVWITRPAEKLVADGNLVDQLRSAGIDAFSVPLQKLVENELDGKDRAIVQDLDQFQTVIVVSQYAAKIACQHFDEYWPQWPIGIDWWAIGSSTGNLLQKQGIEAVRWPKIETSEGLVAEADFHIGPNNRVLIIKGRGGRDFLRQHIESLRGRVTEWPVYQRESCLDEAKQAISAKDYNVVWVTSQENLEILYSAAEHDKLLNSIIIVPSQRIADIGLQMGLKHVLVVDSAHDESLLAELDLLV